VNGVLIEGEGAQPINQAKASGFGGSRRSKVARGFSVDSSHGGSPGGENMTYFFLTGAGKDVARSMLREYRN